MSQPSLTILQTIVDYVWDNPYSSFYRDFWSRSGITTKPQLTTLADWERLPFLTKAEIAHEPNPWKRTYVPRHDIVQLRTTSGTTGTPLLLWRESPPDAERFTACVERGARVLLNFHLNNHLKVVFGGREAGLTVVKGDTHDLEYSATLVQTHQVNAILSTPTFALLFGQKLATIGCRQQISVLAIQGEMCTEEYYHLLREQYPNAAFVFSYGSTESGRMVGHASSECDRPYDTYHLYADYFHAETAADELTLTSFYTPQALPLIRYRTGDMVSLTHEHTCSCGSVEPRFTMLGRLYHDFVSVAGGQIKVTELDRVLRTMHPLIRPDYELHVHISGAAVSLTLFISPVGSTPQATIIEQVINAFDELRLTPTYTVRDAKARGLLPAITVQTKSDTGGAEWKNKRLHITYD